MSFFQAFWRKFFFKFVRGGRNIFWKRSVYYIKPEKLFVFLKRFDEESFFVWKIVRYSVKKDKKVALNKNFEQKPSMNPRVKDFALAMFFI